MKLYTDFEEECLKAVIITTIDRVRWVYLKYPKTLQKDSDLIKKYREEWGSKPKESIIERSGRKLRQHHKNCNKDYCEAHTPQRCFRRDEEATIKAVQQERVFRETFGGTIG